MTSTNSVRDQVNNVLDFFRKEKVAEFVNWSVINDRMVSWPDFESGILSSNTSGSATVDYYLECLGAGQYSALLWDGSLLQLSYEIFDGEVSWHRLGYVPCPFAVNRGHLEVPDRGFREIIEEDFLLGDCAVLLRTPLHFDFDVESAKYGHPAVHLSFNTVDCRIACVAPLSVFSFIEFIFQNFYPEEMRVHATWFEDHPRGDPYPRVISDDETSRLHINWPLHLEPAFSS